MSARLGQPGVANWSVSEWQASVILHELVQQLDTSHNWNDGMGSDGKAPPKKSMDISKAENSACP
jgi:hypothetical protein